MPTLYDICFSHAIAADRHFRLPPAQLDLILGGHDHSEVCAWGDGGASVPIVKSGSDFSEVTAILLEEGGGGCSGEAPSSAISRLRSTHAVAAAEAAAALVPGLALPAIQPLGSCDVGPRNGRSLHFDAFRYFVVGAEPEDAQTAAFVQQCEAQAAKGGDNMQRILGVSRVALDCRFSAIRTAETNVGNMVADLARQASVPGAAQTGTLVHTDVHVVPPFATAAGRGRRGRPDQRRRPARRPRPPGGPPAHAGPRRPHAAARCYRQARDARARPARSTQQRGVGVAQAGRAIRAGGGRAPRESRIYYCQKPRP